MRHREYPSHPLPWSIVFSLLCISILIGMPSSSQAAPLKVVVLTDSAGLGDKGFNDVCWRGVQNAAKDFGLTAQFIQSREQADYISNLTMAAGNADVVVTLGFLYADAVKQVAPGFPKTYFIHIEGDINQENVACFDFKSEEGGFLGGLVAGLFSRSLKVGVVSGVEIPPVEAYVSGFRAGVKAAEHCRKESLETIVASAGSFNDPVKGKTLAEALIDKGADVLYRVAGNTGVGVTEAVKSTNGVFLVSEDLDQDAELPGRILTSTLKKMDVAIYDALRDIVQGDFRGGHRWLGASDEAVDITDMKYSRQLFDAEDLQHIQNARGLLKQGKLTIPKRYSDVDGFQPPNL